MSIDWHQRYLQQSHWTKSLREYLLKDIPITHSSSVLEVGCGTGIICNDIISDHACNLYGIDKDYPSLNIATRSNPIIRYFCSDAGFLPFAKDFFDLVFCHYFLLWVSDPLKVLSEVFRVLKPNGKFLVFAEPDHDSRIDYPPNLEQIGSLQTESLRRQGADTCIGRKLPLLLNQAGFMDIQIGISGFQSQTTRLPDWWTSEWQVIFSDLENLISKNELIKIQSADKSSWENGSRVLWVPTFYALGKKGI